jgi:protein-L-isoaspartate(D-aspartate) O-methyltransferase
MEAQVQPIFTRIEAKVDCLIGGELEWGSEPMTSKGRVRGLAVLALLALLAGGAPLLADETDHAAERAGMVRVIAAHAARGYSPELAREISAPVLAAMGRVPRHEFVPERLRGKAYADRPLPIGYGQTISQPYIVALMTDLLQPEAGQVALELGTGSGYQAAVLAALGIEVHSMEIVPELGRAAARRLERLGYGNARVKLGDGYYGWPEKGPFDVIVVTAAAGHVPPPLLEQLKPGGRMVIPLGEPFRVQQLVLVTKDADGTLRTRQLLPVRFVPLTGGH